MSESSTLSVIICLTSLPVVAPSESRSAIYL
jgi:hypothetical protein